MYDIATVERMLVCVCAAPRGIELKLTKKIEAPLQMTEK
jgi:hypothetical protein